MLAEADLVARDASIFRGRVGEAVASPLVTVVDDGRMAREWGALAIDDEGTPTQRNVLIEDGVLTDFMWDRLRARKEGRASSGNGRRERYDVLPMVRMTNTYVERGTEDPEAIIAEVLTGMTGGNCDVVSIVDRAVAIESAISAAGSADIVVIAGKGHEPYQEIAGEFLAFSDVEVARDAVTRRSGSR